MTKRIAADYVKLKRAYEPATADDGTRILIDRLWPRGVRKADAAIDQWVGGVTVRIEIARRLRPRSPPRSFRLAAMFGVKQGFLCSVALKYGRASPFDPAPGGDEDKWQETLSVHCAV